MALTADTLTPQQQRQDSAWECYRFAADGEVWRYTSSETDVLADLGDGATETYVRAAIGRGRLAQGPEAGRRAVEFAVPPDLPIAGRFVGTARPVGMVVGIWRRYASEDAWRLIWTGRVMQPGHADGRLTLRCEPASVSLRRTALRRLYSRICPHVLYGPECKATPQTLAAVVNYSDGVVFNVDPPTSGPGEFAGGWLAAPDGRLHMIERDVGYGGQLQTLYAHGLAVGDAVTLYMGCDHSLQTCQARFANPANFGGFPWLPRKNPFSDNVF